MKHGTTYAYFDLRCRCEVCKRARAKYRKERMDKLRERVKSNDPTLDHNSYQTYAAGCRCEKCIETKNRKAEEALKNLKAKLETDPTSVKHGGIGIYRAGCRCETCVSGYVEYHTNKTKEYQSKSAEKAFNYGKEWTSQELEIADRYSAQKAAELLGRTYWSVVEKKRQIRKREPKVMLLLNNEQPDTRGAVARPTSAADLMQSA
jgi:hypothetical protein